MTLQKAIEILSESAYGGCTTLDQDFKDAEKLGIEALKAERQYKEYLILVYPKGGGQPKEVWWFQSEDELKKQQAKLAQAQEEFISFKARILVLFH